MPAVDVANTSLTITPTPYDHPVASQLIAATLADLSERYGGPGDESPVDPAAFAPPGGLFLVAYLDGTPVGCGAWRSYGEDAAEIKRMYTAPAVRGRGVARAVLAELENTARSAGKRRMVLETGWLQPEAIAMYERCGYQRIPDFGYYRNHQGVHSFGREL